MQTHGRPFLAGGWFSFSLSVCFSEKLLIEDDDEELLVEMEGESRGRKSLRECGTDLRRLIERGCEGAAVSTVLVGVCREWWFPMIGVVIVELESWKRIDIYSRGGECWWHDPAARSNAFLTLNIASHLTPPPRKRSRVSGEIVPVYMGEEAMMLH